MAFLRKSAGGGELAGRKHDPCRFGSSKRTRTHLCFLCFETITLKPCSGSQAVNLFHEKEGLCLAASKALCSKISYQDPQVHRAAGT